MALKSRFNSRNEIPADQAAHYVERDGAWVLEVEGGFVKKARHDEMRAANIALKQQIEAYQARFAGIDPTRSASLPRRSASSKSSSNSRPAKSRRSWSPASRP
jgi:hypothetical protein